MLQLCHVHHKFDKNPVLKDVSLHVGLHEIVGLLGINGAGKSSLLKIAAGLLFPTAGQVIIDGKTLSNEWKQVKACIGFVPDTPAFFNHLTVLENISAMAQLRQIPKPAQASRIESCLEKFNLQNVKHRLADNLSKGFKQRLSFGLAVLNEPKIILLDEPMDGLDSEQIEWFADTIHELSKNCAIVLSSHRLTTLESFVNRTVILHEGKLVEPQTNDTHTFKAVYSQSIVNVLESMISSENKAGWSMKTLSENSLLFTWLNKSEPTLKDINQLLNNLASNHYGLIEFRRQRNSIKEQFFSTINR
ncbi:MAG: ABC transporter ATP-binding protein [Pseudomonadota bacterium]